jgi:hypothetical protein
MCWRGVGGESAGTLLPGAAVKAPIFVYFTARLAEKKQKNPDYSAGKVTGNRKRRPNAFITVQISENRPFFGFSLRSIMIDRR